MIFGKNILLPAALVLAGAAPVFAGNPAYSEAAAPWTAEQAVRLLPSLTPEFLKEVEKEFGASAAAGLAGKKEKVSGLLKRFKVCALNAEDLKTAGKYLAPDFKAEVRYFAERGCAALRGAAPGHAPAAPRSASFSGLRELSAGGPLYTYEGSAVFFDGASGKGGVAEPAAASAPLSSGKPAPIRAAPAKTLSSKVPVPGAAGVRAEAPKAERPAHFGEDRRVHQALSYWSAMRKENWAAFKKAESGSERAGALLKAAAAAGFGGLLVYSNLEAVETGSARLRWDAKHGAGAGLLASDSAKLVFNSCVFIMAFAPVPIIEAVKAAFAGEGWAIALMAAMSAGTINHYILPIAD